MSYIPAPLRRWILSDAQGVCAYCHSQERLMGVTFEIDHIIPDSEGGTATFDNLCLACPPCNRYKSDRLTGRDPLTGYLVSFFHPHQQQWVAHFQWDDSFTHLIGQTDIGRATIVALKMNRPALVQLRTYWAILDLHPRD